MSELITITHAGDGVQTDFTFGPALNPNTLKVMVGAKEVPLNLVNSCTFRITAPYTPGSVSISGDLLRSDRDVLMETILNSLTDED